MAEVCPHAPFNCPISYHVHWLLDIREFHPHSWRSMIGVVPQDPVLFTGTIASNIAYGKTDATREEIEEAARQANCEFVWGMPKGFDTESAYRARFLDFRSLLNDS